VQNLWTQIMFLRAREQRGFYVDYIEKDRKWVTPQDDDVKQIAKYNIDYVERICNLLLILTSNLQNEWV